MEMLCACCRRPWAEIPGTETPRDRERELVCRDCFNHRGFTMQSDPEHLALWAAYVQRLQIEQEGTVGRLRQEIARLEALLADRPEKIVTEVLGQEEIAAAEDRTERAYWSRDRAYSALCEVRLLHHELPDGTCRHGGKVDQCDVAMIADRFPALMEWEAKQVERLKRDQSHMLPDAHPGVLDRRGGRQ